MPEATESSGIAAMARKLWESVAAMARTLWELITTMAIALWKLFTAPFRALWGLLSICWMWASSCWTWASSCFTWGCWTCSCCRCTSRCCEGRAKDEEYPERPMLPRTSPFELSEAELATLERRLPDGGPLLYATFRLRGVASQGEDDHGVFAILEDTQEMIIAEISERAARWIDHARARTIVKPRTPEYLAPFVRASFKPRFPWMPAEQQLKLQTCCHMGIRVDLVIDISGVGQEALRALCDELRSLVSSADEWPRLWRGDLLSVSIERLHIVPSGMSIYGIVLGDLGQYTGLMEDLADAHAMVDEALSLLDPDAIACASARSLSAEEQAEDEHRRAPRHHGADPQLLLRLARQEWSSLGGAKPRGLLEHAAILWTRMHLLFARFWSGVDWLLAAPTHILGAGLRRLASAYLESVVGGKLIMPGLLGRALQLLLLVCHVFALLLRLITRYNWKLVVAFGLYLLLLHPFVLPVWRSYFPARRHLLRRRLCRPRPRFRPHHRGRRRSRRFSPGWVSTSASVGISSWRINPTDSIGAPAVRASRPCWHGRSAPSPADEWAFRRIASCPRCRQPSVGRQTWASSGAARARSTVSSSRRTSSEGPTSSMSSCSRPIRYGSPSRSPVPLRCTAPTCLRSPTPCESPP